MNEARAKRNKATRMARVKRNEEQDIRKAKKKERSLAYLTEAYRESLKEKKD